MLIMELVLENESGVELLELLAQNALTVANTWFPKKRLHLQTWQHPRSKLWHCKDCAIVRQRLLYLLPDCHAIHSAEYYSHDKLGVQSAETAVGRAHHRQLDWFLDSASTLESALAHRDDLLRS